MFGNIKKRLLVLGSIVFLFAISAGLLFVTQKNSTSLGAGYTPPTGYISKTTSYISPTATTIPVVSTKDPSGRQIDLSLISSSSVVKVYMNIEPGTPNQEPIMCTDVTVSSWTNCTRGLEFQGGSETSSSSLQKAHNAGSAIIITNIGQSFNQFVAIEGDQTINGVKTFTSLPVAPTSSPTDDRQLITLYQLQQATSTGGVNGSETIKGIWEGATQAEMGASTATGTTGAGLLVQNKYGRPIGGSAGYWVVFTSSTGYIDSTFGGVAGSFATLNSNSLVVQNPASATSTPTANSIVMSNASSTLNLNWLNSFSYLINFVTSTKSIGTTQTFIIPTTTIPAGFFATSSVIVFDAIGDFDDSSGRSVTYRMDISDGVNPVSVTTFSVGGDGSNNMYGDIKIKLSYVSTSTQSIVGLATFVSDGGTDIETGFVASSTIVNFNLPVQISISATKSDGFPTANVYAGELILYRRNY